MKSLLITLFSALCLTATAQKSGDGILEYADSLQEYMAQVESGQEEVAPLNAYSQYRLFAPTTFYHSVAASSLSDNGSGDEVDAALMNVYLNHPELVSTSENEVKEAGQVNEEMTSPLKHDASLADRVNALPQENLDQPVDMVVEKPKFWTHKGDYYLQFLQNYISGNWYKGGESNYSMVSSVTLEANYDNKRKWKWDNKLEMKLGFQTSRADSIHHLKASEDLLRLTSKVGLQATKHWYYTLNVLAYTQFMRGYKNNDRFTYSDFASPFNLNVSVGMDYTVEWLEKKLTGHIQLSPLAYNFRYVDRLALSTKNGIDKGKHVLHDIGSMFTIDLAWKFSDNISWKTRMYGFTTYSRSELEWENEFTFKFNKYISSKLFIYPRFDDATTRDGHHGYWQFKEYFSLGFNYTF